MLTIHINLLPLETLLDSKWNCCESAYLGPASIFYAYTLVLASLNWIQPVLAGTLPCAPKNAITSYMLAARSATSHVAH